jgi:pyruvate kinase
MHLDRKTKIVATIGPKTESIEMLTKLTKAGLDVVRLNMSHGDHGEHKQRIDNVKKVRKTTGAELPILMDLSGPKIRTGIYETPTIHIEKNAAIILTVKEHIGSTKKIYINYQNLPKEVKKGSIIMLDDGKKKLIVEKTTVHDVYCKVLIGGELKPRRGVNIPGAYLSVSSITEKDKKDLKFGIAQDVDIVALSFVRTKKDVTDLRKLLSKADKYIPIIVKIETQEAIDNLDEILEEADGAMVARGDLAIEVPAELVPVYQKQIISKCNSLGKPVITATQVLESMIQNPVPTRAEVSDIANAVYDGTDGIMLSEESTLGLYPEEAVEVMSRVSSANENHVSEEYSQVRVQDAISRNVFDTSIDVKARCIIALTEYGTSARLAARFKPFVPVIALTPHLSTVKSLSLSSNIYPIQIKKIKTIEEAMKFIPDFLKSKGLAKKGDNVVVTAGVPFGVHGSTNMLFVITL